MNPKWPKTIRTSNFRPWFYLAAAAISLSTTVLSVGDEYLPSGNSRSNSPNPKGVHKRPDLSRPVQLDWEQIKLREGLNQLSKSTGVPILLDHRIDPDQLVSLSTDHDPISPTLQNLANKIGAATTSLGPAVYIGPPSTAERLQTVVELAKDNFRDRPLADSRQWFAHASLEWDDLASPRELLDRLTETARLRRLPPGGPIPHDLWAANRLDGLSLIERFIAILIQFDLTFEPVEQSGGVTQIRLVPIPESPSIVRRYPGGADAEKKAQTWRNRFPEADIQVVGRQIEVQTTAENHRQLLSKRPKQKNKAKLPADSVDLSRTRIDRFAITDKPLEPVLRFLAKRFGLELDISGLPKSSREKLITISIEQTTPVDLFKAIANGADIDYRQEGKKIVFEKRSSSR
jgi:hypothetical protein